MANSTQTATSDGTLTLLDLSINYLDRAEIKVYANEVLSTTWAWVGTTDKQIKFTPAVANGVVIQVKRTTDASKPRHEFGGGAAFTAQSLDESLRQILHMSQEGLEIPGFAANMKMNGFRITHVADPVAAQDAATKAWVEAATATSVADAAASAASAAASYDSFDDRYLGPKEVAPTLDNDGAALLTGALYWDTTIPGMRGYTGNAWVTLPAATAGAVANTPAGSISATTVQAAIDELDSDVSTLASTKQQADATLTALAAVVNAADEINYATGPDAFSPTPLTAFARTVLGKTTALAAQTALGVATFVTAGTAPDFTLTPSPAVAAIADYMQFRVKFHAAAAAGAAVTIAVSGLAAKAVKQYDANGNKVAAHIEGQFADILYDGADFVLLTPLPQVAIQSKYFTTGEVATGTTLIPLDDTIPQITEGDQYMSLAITPYRANSTLVVEVVVAQMESSVANNMTVAIFRDAVADAKGAAVVQLAAGIPGSQSLSVSVPASAEAATTFYVRIGGNAAGTTTFNGRAGARSLGGILSSSIRITEISA